MLLNKTFELLFFFLNKSRRFRLFNTSEFFFKVVEFADLSFFDLYICVVPLLVYDGHFLVLTS